MEWIRPSMKYDGGGGGKTTIGMFLHVRNTKKKY